MSVNLRRWAAVLFAATPTPAAAHGSIAGFEGFYAGLLHPFSTPSQVLLILGLGLMAGQFALAHERRIDGAFLLAMIGAAIVGPELGEFESEIFVVAFLASVSAALLPGRNISLALAIAVAGGLCVGVFSTPDPGPMRDRLIMTSGSFLGASVGVLYVSGAIRFIDDRYGRPWIGIAQRVVAAYVSAICLLMIALRFAPANPPLY